MIYEVLILPSAERDMDRLSTVTHARVSKRILALGDNPRPIGAKKLSCHEESRIRIGDYRALYAIDDKNSIVTIFAVGHRRDVYR